MKKLAAALGLVALLRWLSKSEQMALDRYARVPRNPMADHPRARNRIGL